MTAQSGQKVFGAGRFYGVPSASNPTPTHFGLTQDISVDFKRSVKELYGFNQLAADVASAELSVSGKVTLGTLNGRLINDLMMGASSNTGQTNWVFGESGTVPSTPYQITVANASGFTLDLGVTNVSTGVPLTRVANSPSTGQYSVANGVYTFAAADTTNAVAISYLYTTTGGQTVTMTNQPMGKTGNFQAITETLWGTEKTVLQLYNCMATDWGMATKINDYTKPTFGFMAGTDATGTLGIMSFAEVN